MPGIDKRMAQIMKRIPVKIPLNAFFKVPIQITP